MSKTLSALKIRTKAAKANKPKKSVRFCPLVKHIYYNKRKATSVGLLRVVLKKHRKPVAGKAQAAGPNTPKKSVRFYPAVEHIYYNRRKPASGGLQRVEYTGYGHKYDHFAKGQTHTPRTGTASGSC